MIAVLLAALLAADQPVPPTVILGQQPAPPPRGTMAVLGPGLFSCPRALHPQYRDVSYGWVTGYFSGENGARGANVGLDTDAWGIFAEVERVCAGDQTLTLLRATSQVYYRLLSTNSRR